MTSATERLRALLDERGVEHYDGTESTLWLKDEHGYRASADEVSDGMMQLHVWCITPEQAVAATLGPGTCRDVAIEGEWFECDECGCVRQLLHPRYCPNCGRKVVG